MPSSELPSATTPEPSSGIRAAAAEIARQLGGRHYPQAVHADRVVIDREQDNRKIALCECGHQGTTIDLPHEDKGVLSYSVAAAPPPPSGAARLCISCDAVARMPRVAKAARRLANRRPAA